MNELSNVDMIRHKLTEYVETNDKNRLSVNDRIRIYDVPLLGIADASDQLFEKFRQPDIVGTDYILPDEWLPGAKSVISYFLPFTKELRDTNRILGLPSVEWTTERIDGKAFIKMSQAFLVSLLEQLGAKAVAPSLDPRYKVVKRISNWSERHTAFAAGLGTFGLTRGIITEKGCSGMFGSIITTLNLESTPRPYTRYDEYCLYLSHGKCGVCMQRCPALAITKEGKNIQVCSEFEENEVKSRFASGYGCGKCYVNVPCENKIPQIQ